jgi:exosortase
VAFPVFYLGFAFPVPKRVDELHVALPLQRIASKISASVIDAVGIPVFREGNVIQIPHVKLCVEEACSGIRSLYSLIALGTFYVFFFEKRTWEKIVLIASTVPIAVLANVIRISGTGMLVHWVSPAMAKGKIHEYAGVLVFLIGLGLLLLEAAVLRFFFPPAEDAGEAESAPA